jgi:C1A family cysteine protease
MSKLQYHYGGWRRSPKDDRDKVANPSGLVIKNNVDPRRGANMPAIYDQGQLGSCTANAVGAALQFDRSIDLAPTHARRPSRLDIYYGERMLEGSPANEDTGAYGRDGFKFAQQTGYVLERAWPYDISTFAGPPPSDKTRHKLIKPYASVPRDVDQIKAVLSNHQTMAFGFEVYASFESSTTANTGIVSMPSANETYYGGHEVLAVGYLYD